MALVPGLSPSIRLVKPEPDAMPPGEDIVVEDAPEGSLADTPLPGSAGSGGRPGRLGAAGAGGRVGIGRSRESLCMGSCPAVRIGCTNTAQPPTVNHRPDWTALSVKPG
jgi:hypothetical protein